MMADEPASLPVGTGVSAKYKGAFCEAKIRKVVRSVKCKVLFKNALGSYTLSDDQIRGTLRTGASVEVRHPEKKEFFEATITKIQDCSQYTVVFDDGDITTLRRTALCLKSGKHFAESETLDQLPLTHPEHFSTPVIGGRRGRRTRIGTSAASSDDDNYQQSSDFSNFKETDIGRVVCVEGGEKRKNRDNWFPALIVAPTAQESVPIRVRDEYLVRSFKDGRYYTVPKKEIMEFTREMGAKVETNSLKAAVEKALQFIDRDELPLHWDRDLLLYGVTEPGSDSELGDNHDSSDDDEPEKKDHFVAQLYKFMDENGTPINEEPVIGSKDVDLFRLYKVVHNLGGFNRVTNQNNWKSVAVKLSFGYNPVVINMVKQSYRKYLLSFEEWPKRPGCAMQIQPRLSRSRSRVGRGSTPKDRYSPKPVLKSEKSEGGSGKVGAGGLTPVSFATVNVSQTSASSYPEKLIGKEEEEEEEEEDEDEDEDEDDESSAPPNPRDLCKQVVSSLVKESVTSNHSPKPSPSTHSPKPLPSTNSPKPSPSTHSPKPGTSTPSPKPISSSGPKEKPTVKRNTAPTTPEKPTPAKVPKGLGESSCSSDVKPAVIKEIKLEPGMAKVRNPKFKALTSESPSDSSVTVIKKEIKEEPMEEGNNIEDTPSIKEKKRRLAVRTPKKEIPLVKGGKVDCLANTRQKRVIKEKAKNIAASIKARTKSSASSIEGIEKMSVSKMKIKEEVTPNSKNNKKEEQISSCPSTEEKKRGRKRKANLENVDEPPGSLAPAPLPTNKNISLGDKLKVYYGPTKEAKITSYEAKVLSTKEQNGEIFYFVHYTGWNTRYDEWIGAERIADNLSWVSNKLTKKQSQVLNPKFRKRQEKDKDKKTKNDPKTKEGGNVTHPNSSSTSSFASKDQTQQHGTTIRQGSVGRSTTPSSIASSSSRSKGATAKKRPQRKAKQNKQSIKTEDFYSDNGSETGDSKNTLPNMGFDNSQSETSSPADLKPNESVSMLAASDIKQEKMDEDYEEEAAANEENYNENDDADEEEEEEEEEDDEEEDEEEENPPLFNENVAEVVKIKTEVEEIDASEYYYYHRSDEDEEDENIRAGISQIVQDSVMKHELEDSQGSPLLGFDTPSSEDVAADDSSKSTTNVSENVPTEKVRKYRSRHLGVRNFTNQTDTASSQEKVQKSDSIETSSENQPLSAALAVKQESSCILVTNDVSSAVEEHENKKSPTNEPGETEDVYEFKEPEPFEFESRKLSDDKVKTNKRGSSAQQSPSSHSSGVQKSPTSYAASSPSEENQCSPSSGSRSGKLVQLQQEVTSPNKTPPILQAPSPDVMKDDHSPGSTPTIQTCEEAFDKICASPLRAATSESRHIELLDRMDNYDEDDACDDDSEDRLVISERDSDNGSNTSLDAKNKDSSTLLPPTLTPAVTRREMDADESENALEKSKTRERKEKRVPAISPVKQEVQEDDENEQDEDENVEEAVGEENLLKMISDENMEREEDVEDDDNEVEEVAKNYVKADASEGSSMEDEEIVAAPPSLAVCGLLDEEEIKEDVTYSLAEDVVGYDAEDGEQEEEQENDDEDEEEEVLVKSEEDEPPSMKSFDALASDSNDETSFKVSSAIEPVAAAAAAVAAAVAAADEDEEVEEEEEELDHRSLDENKPKEELGPVDEKANSGEDENNIESLICEETIPGSPPPPSDVSATVESSKANCDIDAHSNEKLDEQHSSDEDEGEEHAKEEMTATQKTADSAEDENNIESLMCEETIPGSPPSQNDLLQLDEKTLTDTDQEIKLEPSGASSNCSEVLISCKQENVLNDGALDSSPLISKLNDTSSPSSHQQIEVDVSLIKQEIKQEQDNDNDKSNATPSTSLKKDGNKIPASSEGRAKKPEARAPARRGRRAKKKCEDNPRRKYSRQAKHHGSESDDGYDGGNASNRPDPVKNYVPLGRNFLIPQERLAPLGSQQRINLLMQAVQDLRNNYAELKTELAALDKRRKRIRRREREQAARLHSTRNH